MRLTEHKLWPEIQPFVQIQIYARDGGHKNPRVRIEFAPMPSKLRKQALSMEVDCCACGKPIHPVRFRAPAKRGKDVAQHLYCAVACPLDVCIGCSRGRAAREEYLCIREATERPSLRLVPDKLAAVDPLLKWVGGKRWFVREFGGDMFDLVAKRGGKYIEPFLGGGAMALHLGTGSMVLGDVEEDLMITYTAVRDEPEELAHILETLQPYTSESSYYKMREMEPTTNTELAARFIYLNKLCFNGLHRKNKSGGFNVPYGGDRELPKLERIKEVSRALEGAELHVGDFTKLIDRAEKGDVIYADPPYHDTFSDYAAGGFNEADHERLAEALYNARQRGAEFFCHNADTEKVRYWFGDWTEIINMEERRNVNADGKKRGVVPCVLITGVEDDE